MRTMWVSHLSTTICAPSRIRVRVWSSLSLSSLSRRGNSHGASGSFSLIDADEIVSFFIRNFFAGFVVPCFCQKREKMATVADMYIVFVWRVCRSK